MKQKQKEWGDKTQNLKPNPSSAFWSDPVIRQRYPDLLLKAGTAPAFYFSFGERRRHFQREREKGNGDPNTQNEMKR